MFEFLGKKIVTAFIALASLFGYTAPVVEVPIPAPTEQTVGAAQNAVGGERYYLSGSGISSSATTIGLTKFGYTRPDGSYVQFSMTDFGGLGCGTLQPGNQNGKQEFVSFTGITQTGGDSTATLTGVTRGLERVSPYTASSTLQTAHAGGTDLVLSNSPPCFYEDYASRSQNENIKGTWNFYNLPTATSTVTGDTQLTTKTYVDGVVVAGGTDMTGTVKGIGEQAHALAAASSTTSGGTSAPQVITTLLSSASCNVATSTVVVTKTNGRIGKNCIATSTPYDFLGLNVGASTSSPPATLTIEQNGTTKPLLIGDNGTSTPHLLINGRGSVGLGTTTITDNVRFAAAGTSTFQNLVVSGGNSAPGLGKSLTSNSNGAVTWRNIMSLISTTTAEVSTVGTATSTLHIPVNIPTNVPFRVEGQMRKTSVSNLSFLDIGLNNSVTASVDWTNGGTTALDGIFSFYSPGRTADNSYGYKFDTTVYDTNGQTFETQEYSLNPQPNATITDIKVDIKINTSGTASIANVRVYLYPD